MAPERVTIAELLELVIDDYIDNDRRSLADLKMRVEMARIFAIYLCFLAVFGNRDFCFSLLKSTI